MARLIDGRFADYQRDAESLGLPSLGGIPSTEARAEIRLVAGLASQLSGNSLGIELLGAVSSDAVAAADVRRVAAVLSSIMLRDASRPDLAMEALSQHQETRSRLASAILSIHRSMTAFEMGDAAAALAAAEHALGMAEGAAPEDDLLAGLHAVARRNIVAFAYSAGRPELVGEHQHVAHSRLLESAEVRAAPGLASFLKDEFEGRFKDPGQLQLSYRQEDPTEAPLSGALLRAEALGDWMLVHEARLRLGRYQLFVSVGMEKREPVPAFHRLLRADDGKGLSQALKWYRYEGPLAPLREFGTTVAGQPWLPSTTKASLVAIKESADLLEDQSAILLARRLLSGFDELLSSRLDSVLHETVEAVLRRTNGTLHREYADVYQALLAQSTDAVTLQSSVRAIRVIDWSLLPADQCAWWRTFAIENLTVRDDRRFVAETLARTLPMDADLDEAIRRALVEMGDIISAADALATGVATAEMRSQISRIAREAMRGTRTQAEQGQHGMGAYVDAPALLAGLLVEHPDTPGWRDLGTYLTADVVAGGARAKAMDTISRFRRRVPESLAGRLITWLGRPVRFPQVPLDDVTAFRGAVLRARLAFSAVSDERSMADLIQYATGNTDERRQAALSLHVAADELGKAFVLPIALQLSHDSAFIVRASAGRELATMVENTDGPLEQLSHQRVRELLRDPGALVAPFVLDGLTAARAIPDETLAVVRSLARDHPSHDVRRRAVGFGTQRAGQLDEVPV